MKMVEMNWKPTERQLRQFGLVALAALPLLAWLWHLGDAARLAMWSIAGAAGVVAIIRPGLLKLPFLALTLITLPIGMIVGEIVLLLGFYCVFVPIGLAMRLAGRDEMNRSFDPQATTYWRPKARAVDKESYFLQS